MFRNIVGITIQQKNSFYRVASFGWVNTIIWSIFYFKQSNPSTFQYKSCCISNSIILYHGIGIDFIQNYSAYKTVRVYTFSNIDRIKYYLNPNDNLRGVLKLFSSILRHCFLRKLIRYLYRKEPIKSNFTRLKIFTGNAIIIIFSKINLKFLLRCITGIG